MNIAVYGAAAPKPGDETYDEAQKLGVLLAQDGHVVMTGGYIGVMEAASRGAYEAGGHVIGSTCQQLEDWRGTKANPWVKEEWKHQTLRDRMYALIDRCDAAIIMPGGVGTLAELAVMWNEEIISMKNPRLMITVGSGWQKIIEAFLSEQGRFLPTHDQRRVLTATDIHEAVNLVTQFENGTLELNSSSGQK